MPRINDLVLQDQPIETPQMASLDDMPETGSFLPMLQPGTYGFQVPANVDDAYELVDEHQKPWKAESTGPQFLRVKFDDAHPLKIVEAPDPGRVGEPFKATISNTKRKWKIGGVETEVRDFLYLLKKLGEKVIPTTNKAYAEALNRHAGKVFRSAVGVSWNCSSTRNARFWKLANPQDPNSGAEVEVQGQPGCGERYYTDGKKPIARGADGKFPEKIQCAKCGAIVRGFANIDLLRES